MNNACRNCNLEMQDRYGNYSNSNEEREKVRKFAFNSSICMMCAFSIAAQVNEMVRNAMINIDGRIRW